jgi:hypothetical protein
MTSVALTAEVAVASAHVPENNAFKLTRSHGLAAWRHFVPPCDGHGCPSQSNAMFYRRFGMDRFEETDAPTV